MSSREQIPNGLRIGSVSWEKVDNIWHGKCLQSFQILVGIRDRTAGRYCDTWLWRMLDTIDRNISENLQRENQENHLRLLKIFLCIIFVNCFRKWWKWWNGKKARLGQAEIIGIQDRQEPHDWKTALSWINFCSDKDQLKC